VLSLGPAQRGCCERGNYPATAMKLDFPPLGKGRENALTFRQQSTVLVRLLKQSMLDWKAKSVKMGDCDKHVKQGRM